MITLVFQVDRLKGGEYAWGFAEATSGRFAQLDSLTEMLDAVQELTEDCPRAR